MEEKIKLVVSRYTFDKDKYDENIILKKIQDAGVPINDNGVLEYGNLSRQDTSENVIFVWNQTKE
jgi:hypothetical protein